MRTMYDSVTAGNIPANAQMVAGYIDGLYRWSAADWARFPNAVKVRIAVFASTNDGHVLDVERGDATPAQAVAWVRMRRAAGVDPTVYCGYASSGYSWADVRAAFQAAGVPEPHYWVAAYPGIGAQLYPGTVAHQYADPGPYDLSVVADYWPGVDSASPTSNVTSTTGGSLPTAPPDLNLEAVMATVDDIAQAVVDNLMGHGIVCGDAGLPQVAPFGELIGDIAVHTRKGTADAVWGAPLQNGDQGVSPQPAWTVVRDARILAGYALAEATKAAVAADGSLDVNALASTLATALEPAVLHSLGTALLAAATTPKA